MLIAYSIIKKEHVDILTIRINDKQLEAKILDQISKIYDKIDFSECRPRASLSTMVFTNLIKIIKFNAIWSLNIFQILFQKMEEFILPNK